MDPFLTKVLAYETRPRSARSPSSLNVFWTNQRGVDAHLAELRGKTLIVVAKMFDFTSVVRHNNDLGDDDDKNKIRVYHIPVSEQIEPKHENDYTLGQLDVLEHRQTTGTTGTNKTGRLNILQLMLIELEEERRDVVVACQAGVNRSASCLALFLLFAPVDYETNTATNRVVRASNNMTLAQAVAMLRTLRPCTRILPLNQFQLTMYYKEKAAFLFRAKNNNKQQGPQAQVDIRPLLATLWKVEIN